MTRKTSIDKPVPARLFAILPRDGHHAVVFRRGPHKLTAMLRWDLRDDTFEAGQWLRGHVYERRCDLSPDGKHLIAALSKYGGSDALGGYTVICRPPYYTALVFSAAGHAWNGGGYFIDDRRYWIDRSGPQWSGPDLAVPTDLVRSERPPPYARPTMGEDIVLYLLRLLRDGWRPGGEERSRCSYRGVFERDVRPNWTLRKTVISSASERSPTGAINWERHALSGPGGTVEVNEDWAEVDGRTIVFARDGGLFRMRIHAKGPEDAIRLIDTNGMTRCDVKAPYEGVRYRRAA